METTASNQISTTQAQYTIGSVTSKDGTKIGYRQYGHGPGLVLEQGGMGTAYNFNELAEILADAFTVYVPDRRGRGVSPYSDEYTINEDIDDLEAVMAKANTRNVFGLSTGGLIVLKAALTSPDKFDKIAIYESGLSVHGSTPLEWISRYEKEMAQGDISAALVTGMLGPKMSPPITQYIPRPLLKTMIKKLVAIEAKDGSGEYLPMQTLIPTLHHDGQLLITTKDMFEQLRALPHQVLLLNGSKSAAFQKFSIASLAKIIPHAKHVELPGLNHGGAWNYDKKRNAHGNPKAVAQELRQFFS